MKTINSPTSPFTILEPKKSAERQFFCSSGTYVGRRILKLQNRRSPTEHFLNSRGSIGEIYVVEKRWTTDTVV